MTPATYLLQVLRWPEEMASFKAGRECHLDGLVKGLNEALPYLVYKPPPDFFGQVQLEFEIFKTNVADTWQLFLNVWSFCMVILFLQVWFRVFFS